MATQRTQAERLKIALQRAGMSGRKFAIGLKIDPGSVSKWLNGKRATDGLGNNLIPAAKLLDVDPVWLAQDGDYIKPGERAPALSAPPDWQRVAHWLVTHPLKCSTADLDAAVKAMPSQVTDAELDARLTKLAQKPVPPKPGRPSLRPYERPKEAG